MQVNGFTHLSWGELAQLGVIAAGMFTGLGAAVILLRRFWRDEWDNGPDTWPGWAEFRARDEEMKRRRAERERENGARGEGAHLNPPPSVFGTDEAGAGVGDRAVMVPPAVVLRSPDTQPVPDRPTVQAAAKLAPVPEGEWLHVVPYSPAVGRAVSQSPNLAPENASERFGGC